MTTVNRTKSDEKSSMKKTFTIWSRLIEIQRIRYKKIKKQIMMWENKGKLIDSEFVKIGLLYDQHCTNQNKLKKQIPCVLQKLTETLSLLSSSSSSSPPV